MSAFVSVCLLLAAIFVVPFEQSTGLFISSGLFAIAAEIRYRKENVNENNTN